MGIGDKVCMTGRMALILEITITGYVEDVRNGRLKIRIADTQGTTPHYKGVSLSPGVIIWDDPSGWYLCN